MKDRKWLPKALLLGLVFFLAVFIIKPVGVSTQFSMLSGLMYSKINSEVIYENPEKPGTFTSDVEYYSRSNNKLVKSMMNPVNYSFVFVLGIPLGAYVASKVLGKREEEVADEAPIAVSKSKLFLSGFLGGALILYGSRMAGGCTSGHMMSGMMQSSVSGFVFAAAVFAVAIPTAILMKKLYKGGE